MIKTKKVKIVATLGPASDSPEMIERLARAGVNVFRLNFSHKEWDYYGPLINRIRQVEKKIGRPLAILGDVPGPKIRIGFVGEGVELRSGSRIRIVGHSVVGSREIISVNFPNILKHLKAGTEIYLGDADIKLEVERTDQEGVIARVTGGGALRSRMGFSAQGMALDAFALNTRDRSFIRHTVAANLDMIGISFVQTKQDIMRVRKLLPKKNAPMIVAKIETAKAIEHIDEILEVSDALMIARGDLGFSIPLAQLPYVQKELIALCLKKAKPVITATQMLESMIHNQLPTRAEVTDVANAILDGTDAVMLSAETAIGNFPEETVKTMTRIIEGGMMRIPEREFGDEKTVADAVAVSAVRVAKQVGARLIIVFTETGATARRIARHRGAQPIIALSPEDRTVHKLALSWGVRALKTKSTNNIDHLILEAKKIARKNPVLELKAGESFVISAGLPFGQSGGTNFILIEKA